MAINWCEVNFDWNCARAFLVTLEEGSLSAAARALNLTQPTLSRQVAALEEALKITLFERVGRGLEPTQAGLELLEHVRAMGQAANSLSLSASGQSTDIAGKVCISCTDIEATLKLPIVIKQLRAKYPSIEIEILASDSASDLRGREADIAIRAFRPSELDLIAKKLSDIVASLYATPAYLDSIGRPQKAKDFSDAQFLGFLESNHEYVQALTARDFRLTDANFSIYCNNHLSSWEMSKLGLGICVMPIEIGDAEPLVERIIADEIVFEGELWLVSHRELRTNPRVKSVFNFLSEKLGH